MIFPQEIREQFLDRLFNTSISAVIVFGCAALLYLFFARKTETNKQKTQLRSRIIYIAIIVFLLVMVRTWVEGFAHLFTMLSLVAAGLVITNKENILNLSAYLIINWRGLFSEGDHVQIQGMTGYVDSIHLMYFKLYETIGLEQSQATGKTIKIPNALVITQPIKTFSSENSLLLCIQKFLLPKDKSPQQFQQEALNVIQALLNEHYKKTTSYSEASLKRKNRSLSKLVTLAPTADFNLTANPKESPELVVQFYCYPCDVKYFEQALYLALSDLPNQEKQNNQKGKDAAGA